MRTKPRALARSVAQALTVAVVAAGGVVVAASPANAAVPTVTSVFVAGSTTNKVVTAGTTVLITGVGFTGMTDNAADTTSACSNTPVLYPAVGSGCSQVRFVGLLPTATTGYTLATRYTVVSDTQIYATVPTIAVTDGVAVGSTVAGTGSIKVQVVNTMATGSANGISASTTSEVFYRQPLTAALASATVTANPLGGGTIVVGVSPIAALTATTFPQEKLTAYVTSRAAGSPSVIAATVTLKDADEVNVVLPAGSPAGNFVDVMLVHDGITGTADPDSLKYPAVITKLESCTVDVATVPTPLPTTTCSGSATAPGTDASNADIEVTGKGLTGATGWSFDGAGGVVVEDCEVVSDTLAYCDLGITTVPVPAVAAVTFVPADPDGTSTAPALVPTAGSILLYSNLV